MISFVFSDNASQELSVFEFQEIIAGVECVEISSDDGVFGHFWIGILWLNICNIEASLNAALNHCVTWNLEDLVGVLWCLVDDEAKGLEVVGNSTVELCGIHSAPEVFIWHT
jgi:hypothetical protein